MKFSFDWGSVLQDVASSLIVAVITAFVGYLLINRYLSKLNFSNKMQSYGFVNTSTKKQSKREIKEMCDKAKLIKIINVSGFHYLNDNIEFLIKALQRNVEIRFLCSRPDSSFLNDIQNMEYHTMVNGKRMREKDSKISDEILDLISKYKEYGMKIKFYSSEYRLPYVMAYYEDGSVNAWLTMTLPPYKSTKSFVLRGKRKSKEEYDDETNFIDMMECNFDTIWEYNSIGLEEIEVKNDGE